MKKHGVMVMLVLLFAGLAAAPAGAQGGFQAGRYSVDGARVSALEVDVRDRRIELEPSQDQQLSIDYYESDKEFYRITLDDEGMLCMEGVSDKQIGDYFGLKPDAELRVIRISLPDRLLTSLKLSTTNEDICLAPLAVGESALLSNGGNITFERLDVTKALTAQSKNGDIQGSLCGRFEDFSIACRVKKGTANLPEHSQYGVIALDLNANNGDIGISFVE